MHAQLHVVLALGRGDEAVDVAARDRDLVAVEAPDHIGPGQRYLDPLAHAGDVRAHLADVLGELRRRHLVALGHAVDDAVDVVLLGDDVEAGCLLHLQALLDQFIERMLARGRLELGHNLTLQAFDELRLQLLHARLLLGLGLGRIGLQALQREGLELVVDVARLQLRLHALLQLRGAEKGERHALVDLVAGDRLVVDEGNDRLGAGLDHRNGRVGFRGRRRGLLRWRSGRLGAVLLLARLLGAGVVGDRRLPVGGLLRLRGNDRARQRGERGQGQHRGVMSCGPVRT